MTVAAQALLQAELDGIISADPRIPFGVPGAVLAVSGEAHEAPLVVVCGNDAKGVPVAADALLPVSSASKLATGLLILKLIDSGAVSLDTRIGQILPDARAAQTPGVTVRRLLSHTSGLGLEVPHDLSDPPGKVVYAHGLCWPKDLARACLEAAPLVEPGTEVRYSNIGYGLLGLLAERLCGRPFAELIQERVFGPLRVEGYVGEVPPRAPMAILDVATPYAGTDMEPINSELSLRIGAPWSGVTTTAAGLLALVRTYLDSAHFLSPATAAAARTDQTGGIGGGFPTTEAFVGEMPSTAILWKKCPWGLGVEIQGGKRPHWAPSHLPQSFGQIGSSGCLAWCDPQSGVAWSLLAARSTRSGWLLLHGPRVARAAFKTLESAAKTAAPLCPPPSQSTA